jgi:hypothetical protein
MQAMQESRNQFLSHLILGADVGWKRDPTTITIRGTIISASASAHSPEGPIHCPENA